MLRDGKRAREIAQFFGVSEAAISKARKELNVAVVKNVALESAHRVVDKNLNTIDQLQKINTYANEILDLLMRWSRGDEEALHALDMKGQTRKDPRELALKAMQEIRGQLGLQLDIFKTLYDVQAIAEFQKEVLNAIGEVSPDVRDRIIRRLKESRALRGTVSVH
jgi:Asp-tRNA(Asn)/Glu-tRNA(Gln) amidotransferase B subunit